MKGLSLTLEIIIIAIVLLVTALVIMAIFGGQMATIIGILNPWSANLLEQNLCTQKCASYCQGHLGEKPEYFWSDIGDVQTQSGAKGCTEIMEDTKISDKCKCLGIPITGKTCEIPATQCSPQVSGGSQDFPGDGGCASDQSCRISACAGTGIRKGTCV